MLYYCSEYEICRASSIMVHFKKYSNLLLYFYVKDVDVTVIVGLLCLCFVVQIVFEKIRSRSLVVTLCFTLLVSLIEVMT